MTFSSRVQLIISYMQISADFWVSFSPYNLNLDLLSNPRIIILGRGNSEFKHKYYEYFICQYLKYSYSYALSALSLSTIGCSASHDVLERRGLWQVRELSSYSGCATSYLCELGYLL